jgi:hypothetical protein
LIKEKVTVTGDVVAVPEVKDELSQGAGGVKEIAKFTLPIVEAS